MNKAKFLMVAAAALALTACGGGSDGGGDSADVPLAQAPALVQQFAAHINAARAVARNCGSDAKPAVPALTTWNPRLQAAAQKHADDMAKNNFFSHTGSDGSSAADREKAAGYTGVGMNENLAGGSGTPDAITNAWLNSPGHCSSLMAPEPVTVVVAQNGQYTVLMTGK